MRGGGGTYSVIRYLGLFNRDSLLGLVISCDLWFEQLPVICDLIPKYSCDGWSEMIFFQ